METPKELVGTEVIVTNENLTLLSGYVKASEASTANRPSDTTSAIKGEEVKEGKGEDLELVKDHVGDEVELEILESTTFGVIRRDFGIHV